jgi:hypothetical protein
VFFHHSDTCTRGTPFEGLEDVPIRNCSLDIDLAGVKDLPETLKAVTEEKRIQLRVCLHPAGNIDSKDMGCSREFLGNVHRVSLLSWSPCTTYFEEPEVLSGSGTG